MGEEETACVGREGGALRLWLAHESVRQTENLLKFQHDLMTGMEARAVAVIGWAATIGSAIGGGIAARALPMAIGLALVPLSGAVAAALTLLWPKPWEGPGTCFSVTQAWAAENDVTTELQHAEGGAQGLEVSLVHNRAGLRRAGLCLQAAWVCLAATPVVIAAGAAWTLVRP